MLTCLIQFSRSGEFSRPIYVLFLFTSLYSCHFIPCTSGSFKISNSFETWFSVSRGQHSRKSSKTDICLWTQRCDLRWARLPRAATPRSQVGCVLSIALGQGHWAGVFSVVSARAELALSLGRSFATTESQRSRLQLRHAESCRRRKGGCGVPHPRRRPGQRGQIFSRRRVQSSGTMLAPEKSQ